MKKLKLQFKKIFVFCFVLSIINTTFADNVIGDVPSSSNENRTLNRETTIYDWTCDISQNLAFYDWSPVYLRVGQPKWPVSYVFDKTETYVRGYNQSIFVGNIKFPYVSNFVPSTTIDSDTSNILTVDATGATLLWSTDIIRNQPAWQFVTFNNERSIIQNANGVSLNYYYIRANDSSLHNWSLNVIINPNLTTKISCTNYYIARCGDGVIDKETGTTDWNWWILSQEWGFLQWHEISIKPNEVCDDWALNWQPGKCKTDCSGIWDGTETGNMIVTKTLTVEQNYAPEQELQFRINFSNPGSQILENISIEDFLPSGLEYISSEIHWVTNSLFSTGDAWWSLRIAYTGFNLAAGQNWYILINAKLLACNAALNIVNRSALSNWQTISGNTSKQVVCGTTPVSITKTANLRTVQWGQTVRFTITVNNATPNTINDVFVQDIWPVNGCVFMTGTAETSLPTTQTQNWNLTQWWVPWWLIPGQNLTISFLWQTKTDASCVWTHTNTWKVLYWTEQQETNTTVTISQASHNVSIQKTVIQQWFWPWDPVRYEIKYRNNWSITINSLTIKDYRPSSLDFVESTPWPNSIVSPELQTPIVWNITTPLQPNEERSIIINGKIKTTIQ